MAVETPKVNPKVEYIFEAIEKSHVSMTDFSLITKISRESLYRWKDGRPVTDRLRLDLAYTVARNMEKACRLGKLPLVDRYKPEPRRKLLRKIVAEMATK